MIQGCQTRWVHTAHHLLPSEYPVTKEKRRPQCAKPPIPPDI